MDRPGDIQVLCRLCLVKDQVNIPIFEEQGDIRQIFIKISCCLPVSITKEDNLPKKICDGCSNKLDLLYEFWNTSINAEKTLLTWLGQAGVKDADKTITAVALQIPKAEVEVKVEQPEEIDGGEVEDEEIDGGEVEDFEENDNYEEEEPPPKRARRSAAVKAQMTLANISDDDEDEDIDNDESTIKIEDESDGSEGEVKDPSSFTAIPGTSVDDQPGPSGLGKDGADAPMFKIVETLSNGSKKLIIVPSPWEANGQLAWPRFRADKLIKIAHSLPKDSWFRIHCKVRRDYLFNYDVAEEELSRMLNKDKAEQENPTPIGLIRNRPNTCSLLEATAEQRSQHHKVKVLSHTKLIDVNHFSQNDNILLDETALNNARDDLILQSNIQDGLDRSKLFGCSEELNSKLDTILANQQKIIRNQNSIVRLLETTATKDNQLYVIQQLAKNEVTLDMLAKKLLPNDLPENQNKCINIAIDEIKTLDDLEKLEKLLQDQLTMQDYVDRLSVVCGQKGNGNGLNNCYLLVDRLFSRQFMTLCSWAGGARDNKEKIPFKIFKNVIHLFFKVIHLSDTTFVLKDCEEFFKNVIRNSSRRSQSNMLRKSAPKRRPKELVYTKERKVRPDVDGEKGEGNLFDQTERKDEERSHENEQANDFFI